MKSWTSACSFVTTSKSLPIIRQATPPCIKGMLEHGRDQWAEIHVGLHDIKFYFLFIYNYIVLST
jgi:hypothetical protein